MMLGDNIPRATLVSFARAELASRERAYPRQVAERRKTQAEADSILTAWRRIVALLDDGFVHLEPASGLAVGDDGESIRKAWAEVLAAAEQAAEHRIDAAAKNENTETVARMRATAAIRTLITRSALRAGAGLAVGRAHEELPPQRLAA